MTAKGKQDDWQRVADAVADRRAEMGFKRQEDAAEAADVGVTVWREIEGAKKTVYRRGTLTRIAKLFGWPPDMLQRIAAGEDPPASTDPATLRRLEQVEERLGRLEEAVDRALHQTGGPPG